MAGLILLLVFAAGYAVQRGSTCAVAGVMELISDRRPDRFLGFVTSAAAALAVMAISSLLGHDMIGHYRGAGDLLLPIVGGAIFGVGALLNGACAFGTVARLGRGDLARLGTLAGMLAGFRIASSLDIQSPNTEVQTVLLGLPAAAIVITSLGAVALVWTAVRWRFPPPPGSGWDPVAALVLIGLINGTLLILSPGWPYTNLLMDLAQSIGPQLAWRSGLSLALVSGALVAAVITRGFAPRPGGARRWVRLLSAGTIMGLGATLVPGGNDTMLLVGLPLLLPSFILAYLAMITAMASIIIVKPLLQARRLA